MKILRIINIEHATKKEIFGFKVRNTARAVIFDKDNNIALIRVSKNKFHKLPGGGLDEGEEAREAIVRECNEEAGVKINIIMELGLVKEIKKTDMITQNSYCYVAHVVGKKKKSQFTELEKGKGFKILWVKLDEAIQLIKNDGYSSIIGRYIQQRELVILQSAKSTMISA